MESRQALDEFLETIRNADQTFLDPEKGLDTQGKVDGYQHFFHLLQVAVDFYLHNDPLRPRLMPLADQSRKLYGDNVDAVYYFSQVRGDQGVRHPRPAFRQLLPELLPLRWRPERRACGSRDRQRQPPGHHFR